MLTLCRLPALPTRPPPLIGVPKHPLAAKDKGGSCEQVGFLEGLTKVEPSLRPLQAPRQAAGPQTRSPGAGAWVAPPSLEVSY